MTFLALQDVFKRHREKVTGLWKLGAEQPRTLYLDHGDLVFASSTRVEDRLTTLLVEKGKLTQVQMDYVMANLKPGISVGRNLIEMGYITQRDLLEVARLQVERVVWGALATPDQVPVFEARELDANTVRLPFDTPQLLLDGMLDIQDRERLLEWLGPLNQVVVLEGRRHLELTLPLDLAKVPPLLDGTHTLLEISREAPAEPLRVGIFALFLRELGWARMHELPPLDRQALDFALEQDPTPVAPLLPGLADSEAPNLFATIQAAEKPTTNLEHLREAFDTLEPLPDLPELPELEPEPATVPEPFVPEAVLAPLPPSLETGPLEAETGHAFLPTPRFEVPQVPQEPYEPEPVDPPVRILTLPPEEDEHPLPPPEPLGAVTAGSRGQGRWWVLGGLVVLGLGTAGYLFWKRRPTTVQPSTPVPDVVRVPSPSKEPAPVPSKEPTPAPGPEKATAPQPESQPLPPKSEPKETPQKAASQPTKGSTVPEKPASLSKSLEAIRKGDMAGAMEAGEALAKRASNQWALRLEIAAKVETVRKAPELFSSKHPDLFVLPIKLRDGRRCYQVFLGPLSSRAEAERAISNLPSDFRAGNNRPLVFQIGEIPRKQQ